MSESGSFTSRAATPELTPPDNGGGYDSFHNESLDALQTAEQLKLLDAMDKLRNCGVSEFVSLPQIIVCGDQSAGKSSVLEAITQVPFPRKESTCTRFATQIVLRRAPAPKVSVTIIPDPLTPLSPENRKRIESYFATLKTFSSLPDVIDAAGEVMGIGVVSGFSQHVLNVEISGPTQPHLTVVDLPGLIHTGSNAQGSADVKIVASLVENYMKNERTIILAVVTAMNDFQNQIVLTRAKELDPEGRRTLGVITKPDTLPKGSEKEDAFIALARNEEIFFGHGWHVLRNRSYEERHQTFEERNVAEELFFSTGAWRKVDKKFVGIVRLRERLSQLLYGHIKTELPKVYAEIKRGHDDCADKLEKMGQPRISVRDQRRFLNELSMNFVHLCKAAVEGNYEDSFFGDGVPPSEEDCPKRLRGVAQNLALRFAAKLRKEGHTYAIDGATEENVEVPVKIEEEDGEEEEELQVEKYTPPVSVTKKWAVDWVKPLIERSRGRELPGSYNPLLIGNLFWEQSRNWDPLGKNHLAAIHQACIKFMGYLVPHLANEDVADSLMKHWLNKAMEDRLNSAREELKKVLEDRRNHPVTYNHYYTDNVQKSRLDDVKKQLEEAWEITKVSSQHSRKCNYSGNYTETWDCDRPPLDKLLEQFTKTVVVDMDEYAATEVLRCMQAFYKVASKTYVDNISILVVERHLLGSLWKVFSPETVFDMPDELVANIASESVENQNLRGVLEKKKEMLGKGLASVEEIVRGSRLG